MNLFGRKKVEKRPDINGTINNLNEALNLLDKREIHLTKEVEKFRENARKEAQQKNKTKALYFLRNKALYEKQLESILNKKYNLEVQISTLSQAVMNKETIEAMKAGRDTLKHFEKEINVNSVADIMDDITESMDNVAEVSDMISAPISSTFDDAELEKELEQLQIEVGEEELNSLRTEPTLTFPNVPIRNIKLTEEEELKQLEKLMS